jgi:hypothetical protein
MKGTDSSDLCSDFGVTNYADAWVEQEIAGSAQKGSVQADRTETWAEVSSKECGSFDGNAFGQEKSVSWHYASLVEQP